MNDKQIDKLTKRQTDELFTNLIREEMNEDTFLEWIKTWYDFSDICGIAENWDTKTKKETLKEFKDML